MTYELPRARACLSPALTAGPRAVTHKTGASDCLWLYPIRSRVAPGFRDNPLTANQRRNVVESYRQVKTKPRGAGEDPKVPQRGSKQKALPQTTRRRLDLPFTVL